MRPSSRYAGTAIFFSFSLTALIGYPAAAVISKPGYASHPGLWLVITGLLGYALTVFSLIPKAKLWLQLNWLVIIIACSSVLAICWTINPGAVGNNAGMVLLFSIYTAGGPLWLPFIGLVLHFIACLNVSDEKPA